MPIAHIYNGELGFDVRTKLNALIDQVAAIPVGGGSGDVVGPASAIADAVAVYNGTTGKLIKDGGQTIANIIASAVAASGTGDVVGPASAVNARIATYNGVTGKLIQDGGMTIADVIAAGGGGGGGTTILDGSGAPSSGTGAAGDYYVDNDDNIMYGPKAAVGAFGPDQIAIPPATTPAASGSGSYEVGARVVAAVAGEIYAVRYWRYTTTTQIARTVNVWTTGGTLLSSGSVANDGGGSGWKQITLTTPVAVAASGAVFVSVNITNTYGETSSPGFPLSNGGDISITTGSYSVTPGTFPGTTFGNNFFVDAVFHVPVPTWPPAVDGDAVGIGSPVGGGTSGSILYVDSSSNLAQQNANLYFDDANNALKIGSNHTYNIDTFRALYRVPNVAGDNWFEGDAGNPFVTGHENFGTGSQCMLGLTTGSGNTGIGSGSMLGMQSGNFNFAFGTYALRTTQTGSNNLAVGPSAMQSGTNLTSNIGLGQNSLQNLGTAGGSGTANMGIGVNSLSAMINGTGHIGIGASAGGAITTDAGFNANVLIGYQALSAATGTNYQNTAVGAYAGSSITNLLASTIVGVWPGPASALSNIIAINDGAGTYFSTNAPALDWNYTNNGIWSFHRKTTAQGLHVYNTFDDVVPTVNYERGIFDWRLASNVLTIGTQAGGTGVLRPVNIIGSALTFNGSPIGGGGGMAIGGAITSATAGSVLFAGVGGVLAQDNAHLFWDDPNDFLKVGNAASIGAYYLNDVPAIYTVPNVSGNNWFEGNAGNFSCTGAANFATGDQAMMNITTGNSNIAVGNRSLLNLTTGIFNVAFGFEALFNVTTGQGNFSSGKNALRDCTSGSGNMCFGIFSLQSLTTGNSNVAVGENVMPSLVTGQRNLGFGLSAGYSLTGASSNNVLVGYNAGSTMTSGDFNIMIGTNAGDQITSGGNNLLLGSWSGLSTGLSNVIALSTAGSGGPAFLKLDHGYTSNNNWSFAYSGFFGATGLHVYNYQDVAGPPTNYERGIFSWTAAANILTIGTQAGGTGTLRPVNIIGSALTFNGSPIGGGGGMAIGGAVTSGTSGSILYVDSGTNLAQQNANLYFDDANNALKIGSNHTYNIDTFRALYRVPNASGDNWFEGDAGNPSVTGYENFGTGSECLSSLTTGSSNTGIGSGAMKYLTTGYNNFAFGTDALRGLVGGFSNLAIGPGAMQSGFQQVGNVALGGQTMQNLGSGGGAESNNLALGGSCFQILNTGHGNVGIGTQAGSSMTDGNTNTMVGYQAGYGLTGSNWDNTLLGKFTALSITNLQESTLLGPWAGPVAAMSNIITINDGTPFSATPKMDYNYTTAGRWTAAADFAIPTLKSYYIDTFRALYRVPNASGDNWFEGDAGNPGVTGSNNFGTGAGALGALTTGSGNTGVGTSALYLTTTGNNNFAFGTIALYANQSGSDNVAVGPSALQTGIAIQSNVGVGVNALRFLGNGGGAEQYNVAIGNAALGSLTTGSGSVGIGVQAGGSMTGDGGGANTIVGFQAMYNSTGVYNYQNTCLGLRAGFNVTNMQECTILGPWAGPSAGLSNVIAITDGANPFAATPKMDYNYTTAGYWTAAANFALGAGKGYAVIPKAGAPAAGDLTAGTFLVIDDTSAGQTWLVFNKAGTIRKVQLT